MTRTIAAIGGSILIIGLAAFSTHQHATINTKDKTIVNQNGEIDYLETTLDEETNLRILAEEKNFEYETKITELRDSVFQLESVVKKLRRKVGKQDKSLKNLSSKLKDIELSYASLKLEIANLAKKDQLDQQRINELEFQKAEMRNQMNAVQQEKIQVDQQKQEAEADLMAAQMEEARLKHIQNIKDNTRVVYQKVAIQKERFGKNISKIGKKNSKWAYTVLEFQLLHDDHQLLLDEQFIAKVVNADTHEILSYVESNPNFPESDRDSKGIKFNFDGNLIEIAHFNNQKKQGSNFEVQIFYIDNNGQEHLLNGGVRQFIKNRKVVKAKKRVSTTG